MQRLKNRGFSVTLRIQNIQAEIHWICTAEWDAEEVVKTLSKIFADPIIIIRSTMPIGSTEKLAKKYHIKHLAHIPEFLRQSIRVQNKVAANLGFPSNGFAEMVSEISLSKEINQ